MPAYISRFFRIMTVAVLFLGVATACASTGGTAEADGSDEVTIRVVSGMTAGSLTVFAVPATGARNLLGNASANDTTVFTFEATDTRYQLVGRQVSGQEIVSPPFSVRPPETMQWNVAQNSVIAVDAQ